MIKNFPYLFPAAWLSISVAGLAVALAQPTAPKVTAPKGRRPSDETQIAIEQARKALTVKNEDVAVNLLSAASKTIGGDYVADFELGMLHAIYRRDHAVAAKHFLEAVKRARTKVPAKRITDVKSPAPTVVERDLAAALNNLGVVELRLRHYSKALSLWREAFESNASGVEIVQNAGRLAYVAERPNRLKIPATVKTKATKLYLDAWKKGDNLEFDKGAGWLYAARAGSAPLIDRADGLEDRSCQACGGIGSADCPVRACNRGTVPRHSTRIVGYTDTGIAITESSEIRVQCDTCRGRGRVPCTQCTKGIDPDLRSTRRYTSSAE